MVTELKKYRPHTGGSVRLLFLKMFSAENVANFSLVMIFPLLFIYQFVIAQFPDHIEPIFGSGWAITIAILFFWLAYFFVKKFFLQKNQFLLLDYLFVSFLFLIVLVSLLNYFSPFNAQYAFHLLYWNLSGVASNATCYMAFRLAKLDKPQYLKIWLGFAFLSILSVVSNMTVMRGFYYVDPNFYFGFERLEHVWSYQGFARSLLITFFMGVFAVQNLIVSVFFYVVGTLALIANSSKTELILFVAGVPAIIFILGSNKVRQKILLILAMTISFAVLGLVFLPDILGFLKIFSHTRAASLVDLSNDQSFQLRVAQTLAALREIFDSPIFGNYGKYYLETGRPGSYNHDIFLVWVNMGLVGFVLYCSILGLLIKYLFTTKLFKADRVQTYIAGVLGGCAIVAHTFSYTYVDIMLACAVGAVANLHSARRILDPKAMSMD